MYLPGANVDYNTDRSTPLIYAYTIDVTTGALSAMSGSPFPSNGGERLLADSSARFAYLAQGLNGNLYGYNINQSTGQLSSFPGQPFQFAAGSIQLDPTGHFFYEAVTASGVILGAAIDPENGSLKPIAGSPFPAQPGGPSTLQFSSDGRFVYTTSNTVATVYRGSYTATQ